jgi:acetylornithine deacetylase/succinyl-diaminopimelate desuccinylase-like protein/pimeloyl-ACP methyl ester carboxylesterase
MKPKYLSLTLAALLLCAPAAHAGQSAREKIIEALDKGGCARLEAGGVEVCKYDYASGGRNVEAISFRPPGDGKHPALVLIPGYQRSARDYIPLGARFAGEGFACVAITQPGFGRSEGKPDFVGPATIAALSEGVRKFGREPYVDAARLGVFGYSLLAARSEGIRAAVFGGGIYDFRKAYDEIKNEGIRRNMEEEAGLTDEAVRERSSVLLMKDLRCPVLILHGERDESAPVSQALLLRDTLTALKKDFEIKIVPDKGHGLDMQEVLSNSLDFFRRKLASPSPQPAPAPQTLTPHQQLARDIFRELVELNTTQQFGSTRAAEAVAARLKAAGFSGEDVQVVGPKADKMNVVARLRGSGRARPVLFLAHLDVVEAKPEDWSNGLDPFKLNEREGYFYGRGTVDVKDEAANLVASLIRLKREGYAPSRDLIVALTADEEDGDSNGVAWLLQNRRELVDAAYAFNADAGGGQIEKGRRLRYNVQTSEKRPLTFRLEVKSAGGHSSLPVRDNAIYRLAEGLARLSKFDFPVRLNETTRTFFERMSAHEAGQLAADMRAVSRDPADPAAVSRLAAASPFYNSMMRTTCVATMLEAGHAYNALPQTARATVNCRLLPDDTGENVQKTLVQVVADPEVSVVALHQAATSPASPLTPEVMRPVERVASELWPGVPVVPVMDPWASDSFWLRRAGIPTYGVPGVFFEIDPVRAHGKDERVGVREFYEGLEFTYRLLKAVSAGS